MFTATKAVRFSFAHRIKDHPGRCRTLHGHDAEVRVTCAAGSLDGSGMVLDFARIHEAVDRLSGLWDHSVLLAEGDPLADVLEGAGQRVFRVAGPPTAEVLAKEFFDLAERRGLPVAEVEFRETPSNAATYRKEDR